MSSLAAGMTTGQDPARFCAKSRNVPFFEPLGLTADQDAAGRSKKRATFD